MRVAEVKQGIACAHPAGDGMKTRHAGLVTDEAAFMREHLPLEGARVAELGCGKADLARKLLREHGVAEVIGFEVDERQHAANLGAQHKIVRVTYSDRGLFQERLSRRCASGSAAISAPGAHISCARCGRPHARSLSAAFAPARARP